LLIYIYTSHLQKERKKKREKKERRKGNEAGLAGSVLLQNCLWPLVIGIFLSIMKKGEEKRRYQHSTKTLHSGLNQQTTFLSQ
jgi:hypothetical protein